LFEPTALQVHRQAAALTDHIHLIAQHSLRTYGQAWELKQAGLDWRQAVLSRFLAGPALPRLDLGRTSPSLV
jgi:hypothetical protein